MAKPSSAATQSTYPARAPSDRHTRMCAVAGILPRELRRCAPPGTRGIRGMYTVKLLCDRWNSHTTTWMGAGEENTEAVTGNSQPPSMATFCRSTDCRRGTPSAPKRKPWIVRCYKRSVHATSLERGPTHVHGHVPFSCCCIPPQSPYLSLLHVRANGTYGAAPRAATC